MTRQEHANKEPTLCLKTLTLKPCGYSSDNQEGKNPMASPLRKRRRWA